IAFLGAQLSFADEAAEIAVRCTILRVSKDLRRTVGEDETAADEQSRFLAFHLTERIPDAHDTGKAVAIGNADGGESQQRRLFGDFLRTRSAAQEREVRSDRKLGISAHAKSPWIYQRGRSTSRT